MQLKRNIFAAILACASVAAAADQTVGVLMPLSGQGAEFGLQSQTALKMFEEMEGLSDGRGGKIRLVIYDTRADSAAAVNLTRKLIYEDKVVAIIGPLFSLETEVAFPVGVQGKTPIVTPLSAKPGIAANNRPWAFRNALTSDKLVGGLIDKWLAARPKPIKRVVVLVDNKDAISKSDGTVVYPNALKARGVEIVETISFQTGDIDFSAQVTRAKGLNPDGFVVAAFYAEGANLVRELRKQGMSQPIVSTLGILVPTFPQLAGAAAEGIMLATDFYFDSADPKVRSWVAEFQKRAGKPPTNAAGLMFATLHIMRNCISRSGTTGAPADLERDRDRIRQCWAGLKDYPAPLLGATSIDKNGDAVRSPSVIVVKNGKFVSAQ